MSDDKTTGQLAYEADVAGDPYYLCGKEPRKTWHELSRCDRCAWNQRSRPTTELEEAKAENARRWKVVTDLVNAQAKDDGLWFIADSVVEAYFQQELRKLHAAVERALAATEGED